MAKATQNHMIFRCRNCNLERSYPSLEPGEFELQYCWEGECAPERIVKQLGRLPVSPSIQSKPPVVQDRTRYAVNRGHG
jgi:hypothetical protein